MVGAVQDTVLPFESVQAMKTWKSFGAEDTTRNTVGNRRKKWVKEMAGMFMGDTILLW